MPTILGGPPPGQGKSKTARRRRRARRQREVNESNSLAKPAMVRREPRRDLAIRPPPKRGYPFIPSGPTNEFDNLRKIVYTSRDRKIRDYLGTLVDPKGAVFENREPRIPDSWPRATATARSVMDIDVPIFYSATHADSGRFFAAIQPFLGSIAAPNQYKIAISDGSFADVHGWKNTDWADKLAYLSNVGGRDPRLDLHYNNLTQTFKGEYRIEDTGVSQPSPKPFPEAATAPYENGSASFMGGLLGNTASIQMLQTGGGVKNRWSVGPGQYQVFFTARATTTFSAGPSMTLHTGNAADFVKDLEVGFLSTDASTAVYSANITVHASVVVQLTADLTSGAYVFPIISFVPISYSGAMQSGTAPFGINPGSYTTSNSGLTQQYRTVSMSVLATFVGSSLTDGGQIACAYVPGNTLNELVYTKSPNNSIGGLQNWESLAQVPGAMNDRLRTGCYAWWSPEDMNDIAFRVPDEYLTATPPGLLVAGQYSLTNPPSVDTTFQGIVRLEVVTNYEIVTESQLLPSTTMCGSVDIIDSVNRIIAEQGAKHAMQNADHKSWLGNFWDGVKQGFGEVVGVAKQVLPIATSLLGAL